MYLFKEYSIKNKYIVTPGTLAARVITYSSSVGSSNTTCCIYPSGIMTGDIILCFIGSHYPVNSTPTGYHQLHKSSAGYHNYYMGYKVATGLESGMLTAPLNGSEPWDMWLVIVRGATQIIASNGNQSQSPNITTLTTGLISNANIVGSLVLVFGSVRRGLQTLTSNFGTLVGDRSYDANVASAVWSYTADLSSYNATITSLAVTGFGTAIVSVK